MGNTPRNGGAGVAPGSDALRLRRLAPALLAAVAGLSWPQPGQAGVDLETCQRWQRSRGLEAILLGNAIGAAAYLTKQQRLAESSPEHPQLLYAVSDLRRVCALWR